MLWSWIKDNRWTSTLVGLQFLGGIAFAFFAGFVDKCKYKFDTLYATVFLLNSLLVLLLVSRDDYYMYMNPSLNFLVSASYWVQMFGYLTILPAQVFRLVACRGMTVTWLLVIETIVCAILFVGALLGLISFLCYIFNRTRLAIVRSRRVKRINRREALQLLESIRSPFDQERFAQRRDVWNLLTRYVGFHGLKGKLLSATAAYYPRSRSLFEQADAESKACSVCGTALELTTPSTALSCCKTQMHLKCLKKNLASSSECLCRRNFMATILSGALNPQPNQPAQDMRENFHEGIRDNMTRCLPKS